jgi:hypothetical protein
MNKTNIEWSSMYFKVFIIRYYLPQFSIPVNFVSCIISGNPALSHLFYDETAVVTGLRLV